MRGVTIHVNVKDFLSSKVTTREEGKVLYDFIEAKWEDAEKFELDFGGLRIASVSFMDEVFGMLARRHSKREMSSKVRTSNFDEFDEVLYQSIVESRQKEKRKSSVGVANRKHQ